MGRLADLVPGFCGDGDVLPRPDQFALGRPAWHDVPQMPNRERRKAQKDLAVFLGFSEKVVPLVGI